MKHIIAGIFLFITSIYCVAQSERLSLNGIWKFKAPAIIEWGTYHTIKSGLPTSGWDSITVPGNWDTKNEYAGFIGEAVYSKTFTVPASWKDTDVFIHFDAVYHKAEIFINGNFVGKHEGGYTPFEFCISDFLFRNEPNTIVVLVNNTYSQGAWWSWGGISRNVYLSKYAELKIKKFHITALPDYKTKLTKVSLSCLVENLKASDKEIQAEISFDNPVFPGISKKLLLKKSDTELYNTTFDIKTDLLKLWHFDDPNLYTATLRVYSNGTLKDSKSTKFGIRKVEIKGTQFFLNDEPVRAFGFNRISDHRAFGNTEPVELIKRDIDDMKSLGCVLTRIMHFPQSQELLDYCDEKGMLIIEEIPVWGKFDSNCFSDSPTAKGWLDEMIERDYNHPCIIGWSVANEIGIDTDWKNMKMDKEQYRYVSSMIRHIKTKLDNTRLITYASFTAFREKANQETDPAGLCDFISINSYGDLISNCKAIHEKWNNKPVFITEFGRGQIGENINTADIAASVVQNIKQIQELPYVIGASLWSYNDYRSRYRDTPTSGNRSWGVVDAWRNKKMAAKTIQNLFSIVDDFKVSINKNRLNVSFRSRTGNEIPSYKLRNYTIQIKSTDGEKMSYTLPEVLNNGSVISQSYILNSNMISGNWINISIMAQTGIPISERKIALKKMKSPQLIQAVCGLEKMQVEFTNIPEASHYILLYGNKEINLIEPRFELLLDKSQTKHVISLKAVDDNGNFVISKPVRLLPSDIILPPVIQSATKVADGYSIGYSVEDMDNWFEIEYTTPIGTITSKYTLRGSLMLNEKKVSSIRIRRGGDYGESLWSTKYKIIN